MLNLELQTVKQINFSFPNMDPSIKTDNYRVFWVNEPYQNNYVIFAAYYSNEEELNDNIGKTLMIWIGDEIAKPDLTLDTLKQNRKIKTFFWDFDHMNDDIIPSFNLEWYKDSEQGAIGVVM